MRTKSVKRKSRRNLRLPIAALVACLFQATLATAEVRITQNARINGQPVKLGFDTGSERTCLFMPAARRLGLKVTFPSLAGKALPRQVVGGSSEECEFSLPGITMTTKLWVYDPPQGISMDVDGVLAWHTVSDHIFRISLEANSVTILPALPEDLASWTKWPIGPHKVLTMEVSEPDGERGLVLIDTGALSGVQLNSQRWRRWREGHKDLPATPVAFFSPGSGLLIREECWADNLEIAGFSIADVPVMQGRPDGESFIPSGWEATLGFFGLSRFEAIVDGAAGNLYMRPVSTSPRPYSHNRLGAVFTPGKDLAGEELVGYVVEGSPAYLAGIRSGDVLLSIDELDVTKWRTDPRVLPLSRFWERPAGTRLHLALQRQTRRFECVVALRDILCPRPFEPGPPPTAEEASERTR
jgi:hypothetical protein